MGPDLSLFSEADLSGLDGNYPYDSIFSHNPCSKSGILYWFYSNRAHYAVTWEKPPRPEVRPERRLVLDQARSLLFQPRALRASILILLSYGLNQYHENWSIERTLGFFKSQEEMVAPADYGTAASAFCADLSDQ